MLKRYRSQQLVIEDLIRRVLGLFDQNKAWDLVHGFRAFISTRHHDLYDSTVREHETTRQSPIELSRKRSCPPPEIEDPASQLPDLTLRVTGATSTGPATAKSGCPVCKDPISNGYVAKCGHACCFVCWNSWLQIKLECPLCGHRTRIPQLKRVNG